MVCIKFFTKKSKKVAKGNVVAGVIKRNYTR